MTLSIHHAAKRRESLLLQRRLIQLDGAVVVAFHLCLISVLQNFPCSREGLQAHGHIVSTWSCKGQKYESPGRAGEEPVPCDGYGVEIGTANRENSCVPAWPHYLAITTS